MKSGNSVLPNADECFAYVTSKEFRLIVLGWSTNQDATQQKSCFSLFIKNYEFKTIYTKSKVDIYPGKKLKKIVYIKKK